MDDFETNALEAFLAKNRFSDYLEKFLACGYDDFSFIINLDESDILEMLKDVGMTKVGHVKKFVAVWKAKKFSPAESYQESSKIQKETSADQPTKLPKDVEELLIPSPVNEKQKFYNDVTHALYKESYSLMVQDAFRRYACSQRAV